MNDHQNALMLLSNINVLYQVGTKHWHSTKISTGQWPLRRQKVHHDYRDAVWNRHDNPVSCCSVTMRHRPPIYAQLHAVGRGPLLTATPSLWRCASSNTSPLAPNLPHLTHPKSPGSLGVYTMKSTCTRNLTRRSTPMPIQLKTRWKFLTCFRLITPSPVSHLHSHHPACTMGLEFVLANAEWKQC